MRTKLDQYDELAEAIRGLGRVLEVATAGKHRDCGCTDCDLDADPNLRRDLCVALRLLSDYMEELNHQQRVNGRRPPASMIG